MKMQKNRNWYDISTINAVKFRMWNREIIEIITLFFFSIRSFNDDYFHFEFFANIFVRVICSKHVFFVEINVVKRKKKDIDQNENQK